MKTKNLVYLPNNNYSISFLNNFIKHTSKIITNKKLTKFKLKQYLKKIYFVKIKKISNIYTKNKKQFHIFVVKK